MIVISKNNLYKYILIGIFLFPILFDLLYGFLNVFLGISVPISSLYRISIFLLLAPFIFLHKNFFLKFLIATFTIFFVVLSLIWTILYDNTYILREYQQYIRVLYPYILLGYLFFLSKKEEKFIIYIFYLIVSSAFFASLSIYFSFFSGIGLETYGDYSFATSSFFVAQNDITLSLLLSINISMYLFFTKGKYKFLFLSLFILGSLFALGTRAGSIGGICIIISYMVVLTMMNKDILLSKLMKVVIISFIAIVMGIFVLKVYELIQEYQFMLNKYETILEHTPRAKLEYAGNKSLSQRTDIENIFGKGTVLFCKEVEKYYPTKRIYAYGKFVEEDILDMIGSYGYVFGSFLLLFPFLMFLKSLFHFLFYTSIHTFFLFVGISLFVIHAILAGHAINSPTVASFIVIYYYLISNNYFIKGKMK